MRSLNVALEILSEIVPQAWRIKLAVPPSYLCTCRGFINRSRLTASNYRFHDKRWKRVRVGVALRGVCRIFSVLAGREGPELKPSAQNGGWNAVLYLGFALVQKTSRLQLRAVRSSLSSLAFQRVLPERQRDFRAPGRNPRFPSISVSVSGGTFGPLCPASNLELGLSRRVISTRNATKLQYYTNSGSDISTRTSYGGKVREQSCFDCEIGNYNIPDR